MGKPIEMPEFKIAMERMKEYTAEELSDLKEYIGYTDSDIYGLEADFENNRFTRLAGAVGKTPGADFDSINAFGGRRRCAVSWDGTTVIYRGDSNYEEDAYLNNLGILANVMVEQPKFYYKLVPLKTEKIDGADGYHLRKARYYISDTPKAGFKVHPAFIQNGREVDKIYLSAYEGCLRDSSTNTVISNDEQVADFDNDQLLSIANAKPASGITQALTRANARKLAQNIGVGWGITTIQTLSATQLLFVIEYATFNSQSAIGNGVVNATEPIKTGSTSSFGNASGSVASGGVSYRGEENLWGNSWNLIDGMTVVNSESDIYGKLYKSNDINLSSAYVPYPKTQNQYISKFGYFSEESNWWFVDTEHLGNSGVPIGDLVWNGFTGMFVPAHGGNINMNTSAGLFCYTWYYTPTGGHGANVGARLIYIPQPETITQEVTE